MTYRDTDTALLLLDLQNEMVDPQGKIGAGGLAKVVAERDVLATASRVLEGFRQAGRPVAHVRVGFRSDYADTLSQAPRIATMKQNGALVRDSWGCEFPEVLAPRPDELVFTKQAVNPFFNTGLMSWLQHIGVQHVVLAGVVTNLVVESTARYADDAGLRVSVLEDGCASPNAQWHQFAVENTLPLFGRVTDAATVLGEL